MPLPSLTLLLLFTLIKNRIPTVKLFAIDPTKVIIRPLTCQEKETDEDKVFFKFKVLTITELADLEGLIREISSSHKEGSRTLKQLLNPIEMSLNSVLKGWSNFKQEDGTLCEYNQVKDNLIDVLGFSLVVEILSDALSYNSLSKEDEGN